jgi:hypothetical protein
MELAGVILVFLFSFVDDDWGELAGSIGSGRGVFRSSNIVHLPE